MPVKDHHQPPIMSKATVTICAESNDKMRASANLPEDIICEILRYCTGSAWSYRELALLCRINKDWSRLAMRTLYQDLRLDYRREVDSLAETFANQPQAAELVRSIVINGDGAHGPNIYRLLKQFQRIRHILFFDFELGSVLEEHTLCATVPLQHLTSLSFSVMPPGFVDKAIQECGRTIRSLRIYRVGLAGVNWQPGREDKPRWRLPNLRTLSLQHVGNIPNQIFQELIVNTSTHLHALKVHYERPYEVCRDPFIWEGCTFTSLERLELGSFSSAVVSTILRNNGNPLLYLHTLKLPSLRQRIPSPVASNESSQPSPPPEPYTRPFVHLLNNLPSSIEILELDACQDATVCRGLPDHLDKHMTWLPKLRRCPTLTLGEDVIQDDELAILRIAYFAAAKQSALALPEASQYYALKGYF